MHDKVTASVTKLEGLMVKTLARLCSIPAVSPHNGGTGEDAKILELAKIIDELGLKDIALKVEYVDDEKAQSGKRPSLFLEYPGKKSQRLCILSHIDVVPEGDLSAWTLDPFKPEVRGSRIYGRGVSDNGMCLVSSLFALKALQDSGITPEYSILLAFVCDEELGSHYGLEQLIERDIFRADDLVLVPDSGNDNGDFIETAEKSVLRMKFTVTGKQVHAAYPTHGINACRAANMLAHEVDDALHKKFTQTNDIFDVPFSTFEPTKRAANVPAVNIVPGREVFEFDCRILPEISLDDVIAVVNGIVADVETRTGAKISVDIERTDAPEPTSPDSEICRLLMKSIREVLKIEPVAGGIGGGTFAVFFRKKGIPAVVWSQECDGVAHQPDEYTEISYLVNNAKVFALMMAGE